MFKPQNWLDRVFEIGIIAKGLNGAVELLGGLLLLFVSPAWIHQLAISVTRVELSEDPHDFIATHLLHTTSGLTGNAVLFGSVYLLTHGAVKVVLVVALLLNKLWAYPWMIVVLLVFIGYQLYRISLDPTAGLLPRRMIPPACLQALVIVVTRKSRCRPWAAAQASDARCSPL
jgi:uncharacterized membrane protein